MVDTFRPLDLCEAALACEDTGYAWSWAGTVAALTGGWRPPRTAGGHPLPKRARPAVSGGVRS